MTGFQKFVNQQPAPAEPGDFAGANPRMSIPSPQGGFKVGADPLIVGRFAWGNPATGLAESNSANGGLLGFVHRENQTIITEFLGESRMAVQAGFPVTLMGRGEFWADVGAAGCDAGEPVYANNTTGLAQQSSSGGTLTPYVFASTVPVPAVTDADTEIDAETGVMHVVSALASGVLEVGMVLTWPGMPANAHVVLQAQLETEGGDESTWQTSFYGQPAVAATTVTGTQGTMAKISTWIQPNA